jgi:hypothetical protein
LFRVTSADTFATESRGRPVTEAGRKTFPGALANFVFEVSTATITVARRLTL